jgi:hypothetical protein
MRYLRDRDEYVCVKMRNTEVEQDVSSSRKPTYHSILSILATATSSPFTQPHLNASRPNPLRDARSMHILLGPNPNLLLPLFPPSPSVPNLIKPTNQTKQPSKQPTALTQHPHTPHHSSCPHISPSGPPQPATPRGSTRPWHEGKVPSRVSQLNLEVMMIMRL